ncbi:hypothetical protein JQ612_18995 [Bradyrhizobium manausense]|uniref:hypothetical protein n=1 Tax=Bradyrhizobium manausense TaxID=989370 RepID=UPI001BAB82E1|nr:hypothetical protein [Bradyrhizobium manausense]MBR0835277.1 hypothetical protein [Bradyrhizobium manausense]
MLNALRLFAFLVGTFSLIPAQAGQVNRLANIYYEDIFGPAGCQNTNRCSAVSSLTPSDALLSINHVYCAVTTRAQLQLMYFQVWTAPPGSAGAVVVRSIYLGFPPVTANATNGFYYYNFDQNVFFLVGQNRYVVLSAQTIPGDTLGLGVSCSITGTMVPPQ